jgi:hypothetical protein
LLEPLPVQSQIDVSDVVQVHVLPTHFVQVL